MFTKEDISKAKSEKNVCVIKDAFPVDVKWKDALSVYDSADEKDISYISYTTLVIQGTQNYTDKYNNLVSELSKIHNGTLVGINSIVHFFNRNDDTLDDEYGLFMRNTFCERTPNKKPKNPYTYEQMAPSIHVDAADGFFIQNEGLTKWKIYRDEGIVEHTLSPGDIIYIPKYVIHSVESLTPRHSASIVFKDPQHFLCKTCGSLNI